ncbi:unnamed protein product [Citrullus colocynthis]|uniref:Uncharacterized protein n=1 Tax=Citrullus colocynthis TaxID=252529 RepID=A0ABP0YSW5_9ROSI
MEDADYSQFMDLHSCRRPPPRLPPNVLSFPIHRQVAIPSAARLSPLLVSVVSLLCVSSSPRSWWLHMDSFFVTNDSSLNGPASNLPDGTGRSFATSFSGQSGVASPVFHHSDGACS